MDDFPRENLKYAQFASSPRGLGSESVVCQGGKSGVNCVGRQSPMSSCEVDHEVCKSLTDTTKVESAQKSGTPDALEIHEDHELSVTMINGYVCLKDYLLFWKQTDYSY